MNIKRINSTSFITGKQIGEAAVRNLPSNIGHGIGFSAGVLVGAIVGTGKLTASAAKACVPNSVRTGFRRSCPPPIPAEQQPAQQTEGTFTGAPALA
jgi:hypothetical protein